MIKGDHQSRKGFTITEVMVCLLIIVVLSSLLMPVFQRSKSSAKSVVCISNLRQVYLALKLYESDHGEYPPNSVVWPTFQPYYPSLLVCPASRDLPEFSYILQAGPGGFGDQSPFFECRDLRQGDIPLVIDINHASTQHHHKNTDPIFVSRENGAVSRIIVRESLKLPRICQSPPLSPSFNY